MANFDADSYFSKRNASKEDSVAQASLDKKARLNSLDKPNVLGPKTAPNGAWASTIGIGAAQIGEIAGTGYGLATGNMQNPLRVASQEWGDTLQERKPQGLINREDALQERIDTSVANNQGGLFPEWVDEAAATLGSYSKDPGLILHTAVEETPSILAQGGTSGVLKKLGLNRIASMLAGNVAGGAEHGVDTAGGVYDRLMDGQIPQAEWDANADYQRLRSEGKTDQESKHVLALDLARSTAMSSGFAGIATELVPGGTRLQKSILGDKFGEGLIKGAAKTAGGQFLQESIQEGTGQYLANRAVKEVKRDQNVQEGVGQGAATGGLAGGTIAAPFGAFAGRQQKTIRENTERLQQTTDFMESAENGYETGDVGELNNPESANFNPTVAVAVLDARQEDKSTSQEEREAERKKAQDIRDQAQQRLEAAQKTAAPGDRKLSWLEKRNSKAAIEKAQEQLDGVDEALEKWDSGSKEKQKVRDAGVKAVDTISDPNAPSEIVSESVDEILAAVAVDENSISIASLNAVIDSGNLSEDEKSTLRAFSEAQVARNAAKNLEDVEQDILQGDRGFKGLNEYRKRILTALNSGDQDAAQQQIAELSRFLDDHNRKLNASITAQQESAEAAADPNANRSARYMYRDPRSGNAKGLQNGNYLVTDTAPWSNEAERMAMGGRVVLGKGPSAQKFTNQLATEVEAIQATLAELEANKTLNESQSTATPATDPTPEPKPAETSTPAATQTKPYEADTARINKLTLPQLEESVTWLKNKVASLKKNPNSTLEDKVKAETNLAAYENRKRQLSANESAEAAAKKAKPEQEQEPAVAKVTPIQGKENKAKYIEQLRSQDNELQNEQTVVLPVAAYDTPDGETVVYGRKVNQEKQYSWFTRDANGVVTKLNAKSGPKAIKEAQANLDNAVPATEGATAEAKPEPEAPEGATDTNTDTETGLTPSRTAEEIAAEDENTDNESDEEREERIEKEKNDRDKANAAKFETRKQEQDRRDKEEQRKANLSREEQEVEDIGQSLDSGMFDQIDEEQQIVGLASAADWIKNHITLWFNQRVTEPAKGTALPLVREANFFNKLFNAAGELNNKILNKYLKADDNITPEIRSRQVNLLTLLKFYHGEMASVVQGIHKGPTKRNDVGDVFYGQQNYVRFLENEDGTLPQAVVDAMVVAGFEYVAKNGNQRFNDETTMKIIAGIDIADELPSETRDQLLMVGSRRNMVIQELGRSVAASLGLRANSTAPPNAQANLETALGIYALTALMQERPPMEGTTVKQPAILEQTQLLDIQKTVEQRQAVINNEKNPERKEVLEKDLEDYVAGLANDPFIRVARDRRADGSHDPMAEPQSLFVTLINTGSKETKSLISRLFGTEESKIHPEEEPGQFKGTIRDDEGNQKQVGVKKSRMKLPKFLSKILKKKSNREHYISGEGKKTRGHMSEKLQKAIAGIKDFKYIQENNRDSHNAKQEAKNRSFENLLEWESIIGEKPFFFTDSPWVNQRVGQLQNLVNMQTDKLHRHSMYMKDWVTSFDITQDGNTKMERFFYLSVAQGVGMGTDKEFQDATISEIKTRLSEGGDLYDVAQIFMEMDQMQDGETITEDQENLIEAAIKELGTEYAAFDALVQYASYANAKVAINDPTKRTNGQFKARAFYEVDGAANGVALAQISMGTGGQRGPSYGFFNRAQKEQYGSTVGYKKSNNLDPYQTLISLMDTGIPNEDRQLANAILNILTEGKGAFNEDGGVTGAGRNVVKELVTAIHYGASVENYVNNVGFTMLDGASNYEGWYVQLQEAANESNGATEAIQNQIDRLNAVLPVDLQIEPMNVSQAMEFTLSNEQRAAVIFAWESTVAPVMIEAANEEYGDFLNERDKMNQSANALFAMYKAAFDFLYEKKMKELDVPRNKKGLSKQDLSQDQVDKIYAELGGMSNVVHTPMSQKSGDINEGIALEKMHRKFVRKEDKGTAYKQTVPFANGVTFNQDADEDGNYKPSSEMSGSGQNTVAEEPGVRAMPLLIMSLDSATLHAALESVGALGLHDALAMGLNDADRGARELNKQVYHNLIEYSVPMAVQEALDRAFAARAELIKKYPGMEQKLNKVKIRAAQDSDLPVVWEPNPKKPGKNLPFVYVNDAFLATRRATAVSARAKSLTFLAAVELVDQYVHETGGYEVQPEDQALYENAARRLVEYSNSYGEVTDSVIADAVEKAKPKPKPKKKKKKPKYASDAVEHGTQGNDPVFTKALEGKTEMTVDEMATAIQNTLKANLASGLLSKAVFTFQNSLLIQMKRMMPANTTILYVDSEQLKTAAYKIDNANEEEVKAAFKRMEKEEPNGWGGMTATLTDGTDVVYIRKPEAGSIVNATTALHEMVHVVAQRTITRFQFVNDSDFVGQDLDKVLGKDANAFKAISNLRNLMNEAKKTFDNSEFKDVESYKYAFTNLGEFVAVGMSDPAFQRDILMNTTFESQYETKTGLSAFVQYLTDIIWPDGQSSVVVNGMNSFVVNSAVLLEDSAIARQAEAEARAKWLAEQKAEKREFQEIKDALKRSKGIELNPMVVGKHKGNVIEFEVENKEAIDVLEQLLYGWIDSLDEELKEYDNNPVAKKAAEDGGVNVEELRNFRKVILHWGAGMLKAVQDKGMTFSEAEDYVREKTDVYDNPRNIQVLQNLIMSDFLPQRNGTYGETASPKVQKAMDAKVSPVQLLRTIQSEGGLQGEIAGYLAKIIKNKHMGIRYSIPSDRQKSFEDRNGEGSLLKGQYGSDLLGGLKGFADGQVALVENASNEVIVHEFVHSITSVALRNGNSKKGTAAEKQFAERINGIWEIFQIAAEEGGVFDQAGLRTIKEYALINPDEMMAVLLSHPGMMEAASKIRVTKNGDANNPSASTIWSEVVNAIADLLGFNTDQANLLSELLKEVAMVNEPIDTLEKAQKQNLDRIREHERLIAQLEADLAVVKPLTKQKKWQFWTPTTQDEKDAAEILKKLKDDLFNYKSFRKQLFDKQVSLNEKLGIDSPVGRSVNESLISAFNAIRSNGPQPGPAPVSPMAYTTEQIFEALNSKLNTPLSSVWANKLRYALGSVVDVAYGNSGAVRADVLSKTPVSADDVFIQSIVEGKAPFASSLISIGLSEAESFTAQSVEMMFQEALGLKTATSTQVRTELKTMLNQVLERVKGPEDLIDPATATQAQRDQAESAYKLLTETAESSDPTRYLAQFAAMAMTYEPLNRAMNTMYVQRDNDDYGSLSLAGKLGLLFEKLKRMLARRTTWTQVGMPLDTAIVAMGQRMASIEARKQAKLTREKNSLDGVMESLQAAGESVDSTIKTAADKTFTEKNVKAVLGSWTVDKIKDGWDDNLEGRQGLFRALLNELRINKDSLQTVSKLHNEMHKHQNKVLTEGANVATMINNALPVTDAESEAVTIGLLNNDISSLLEDYSLSAIRDFFANETELDSEISALEAKVKAGTADTDQFNRIIKQAMDLGFYLQTGNNQNMNLMFNAHNIVMGANTAQLSKVKGALTLQGDVDKLISLYGIRSTEQTNKKKLVTVMDRESRRQDNVNGINTVMQFHIQLKKAAVVHEFKDNPWSIMKGYRAEIFDTDVSFEVANEKRGKQLEAAGYKKLNDEPVLKDPNDPEFEQFMYVIDDGGLTETVKGAFSQTAKKAKGQLDRTPTDMPVEPPYKGDITKYRPKKTDINYQIPVIGPLGTSVAKRYTMQQSTKNNYLRQQSPIAMILGKMASQALDKAGSTALNKQNVETLRRLYDEDQNSDNPGKDWIKVYSGSPDKRVSEAYDLLTKETRRHIKEVNGEPVLYVKAEAFDIIFGYRKYSLGDKARIKLQKGEKEYYGRTNMWERNFIRVVSAIPIKKANGWEPIGEQAALRISQTEDVWQTLVKYIKNAIVIKSIVVWMGNATSNASILAVEGVSPTELAADTAVGWEATDRYVTDRNLKDRIDYQLAMGLEWIQYGPNKVVSRKSAQQKTKQLQIELDNNPVEPLMREGQYQSLVEDIEIEGNQYEYRNRLQRGIDAVTGRDSKDSIVQGGRKVAETVLLADGTDAYEMLKSGTTKSDFVSRYVLYKHLTTRKNNPVSHEEATKHVRSSFINYDLPTHKGVMYMNDMGFVYFTKFLIRIQSIVIRLALEHPIRMGALALAQGIELLNDIPLITETFVPTKSGYQISGYLGIAELEDNPISKFLDALRGIAPIAAGEAIVDSYADGIDTAQQSVYG